MPHNCGLSNERAVVDLEVMDLLHLTILGDPIPKGRPRTGQGRTYTPARTVKAEGVIRAAAAKVWGPWAPYDGPVGIEVTFYFATRRRTDFDNCLKLITDALQRGRQPTGGVILDDAQIEQWAGRLYRRVDGQEPRTEIRLYALAST